MQLFNEIDIHLECNLVFLSNEPAGVPAFVSDNNKMNSAEESRVI